MNAVVSVDVEGDFGTSELRGVDEVLPALLDGLEARGIRAVLFVVGEVARARARAVRAAADRGHLVASHGMTHVALGRVGRAARRAEIADSKRAVEDVTGAACLGFRAPFFDAPADLGPLLEEAGYAWSSSKAPFSPVALYASLRDTRAAHRLAGSRVVELPVSRVLGLPMPDGLSYRRAFWPLTALARTPPAMFYLHPYELLDDVRGFALPGAWRRLVTVRGGARARRMLWACVDGWRARGTTFHLPTPETLACVT